MPVEKGDVVELSFVARVLNTGEVFDTTDEEVAKKEGIWDENASYGPQKIIVGAGEVVKGLEEALIGMEEGEEKKVVVPPEKGFGKRNPSLVRVISLSHFKKHKIDPFPGLVVEIDGKRAVVQSVDGGRVRVDFNHPLAGKSLEYEVRVEKVYKELEEKVGALVERDIGKCKFSLEQGVLRVELENPKNEGRLLFGKMKLRKDIFDNFEDIREIVFVERFKKSS